MGPQDDTGLTPYMAALLAGYSSLAETILKAAHAQFSPSPEKESDGGGGEDYTKVNRHIRRVEFLL